MRFLSPEWLLLLVLVAVIVAAYLAVQLRRTKFAARFSNVELLGSIAPRRPGWRRHLTFALLLIGLSVLSVGVAGPTAAVRVPRERATVIMDIDISLSMEATDILPSRLAAAKAAAIKFVGLLPPRINLGLVAFGGNASLLVPPTVDRDEVRTAIGTLKLEDSTAIGEAIYTSLDAIRVFSQATTATGDQPPPARIVLLSDGANTVGRSPASAAQAAAKAKVQVSTIAFGRADATITYDGQTVPVPPDPATLHAIAQETGGTYQAAASAQGLQSVYQHIGSQIGYTTVHKDISWRFLVIGLLFVMAAAATSMLWSGRLS